MVMLLSAGHSANGNAAIQEEVLIGTRVAPPFVIKQDGGSYSGLSVALWEKIATEMGITYTFEETDIQGMLDGVADGSYFASISAITITSEREEVVDFSHPFYVTGLGIAVRYKPAGIWQAFTAIFSPQFLWVILLLLLLLLFWGVLVWVFERKRNMEDFGGTAMEGVGSGFWWAAVTMTTVGYGDKSPRTFGGRVVGFLWMFTSIIVISFFTAAIASSLTVNQLDTRVSGPQDLPFVRTGALSGSAPAAYLTSERIRHTSYATLIDGLNAIKNNEIDAFVHDAPILKYYAFNDFGKSVRVLPNTFNDQYYGIALELGSPYRNEINKILLDYINSMEWLELQKQYLGDVY